MTQERSESSGGRSTRRGLLAGAALAGVAGLAASVADVLPAMADDRRRSLTQSPSKARPTQSAAGADPFLFISGLSFRPLDSTYAYSSSGSRLVPGINPSEYLIRLQLPQGSMITGVTFYVENTAAGVCNVVLGRFTPDTGDVIAPLVVNSPTASTAGVQAVALPVGSPWTIDNATYEYWLDWQVSQVPGQDLVGAKVTYILDPGMFPLSTPVRILDTRVGQPAPVNPGHPLLPGSTFDVQVTGSMVGGVSVPAGARAVYGNITVTNATGGGLLRLFPTGVALPTVSSINFGPADTANAAIVGLNAAGKMSIYTEGSAANVIFDASGYVV